MKNQQLIAERYELGDLLDEGGVGVVYHGTDTRSGDHVAVKVLKPEIIASYPDVVERFSREAEALRALNHPNIVKVLAATRVEDVHCLVMEYVSGGSLCDRLDREGRLTVATTIEIALDLADALTRAHRLGVIHRDIKPANVLLAQDGTPRLTDFGLAFVADGPRLTPTAAPMGTMAYLSPEACRGEQLDTRTDIWAFGVTLFEMLTGRCPFDADNPLALALSITTEPTPNLGELCPGAPAALVNLIHNMLNKDRAKRIASVRLVGAELEAIALSAGLLRVAAVMPDAAAQMPDIPAMPKHNFPVQTTRFFERQKELSELADLLSGPESRLITIVGPGGIGKTHLALEAAGPRMPDYEDGVYFVPLAPLRSVENVIPTIADVVGFQVYEGDEPRVQLLGYLSQKHMLLVLDNFEHLLVSLSIPANLDEPDSPGAAELVSDILTSAPGCSSSSRRAKR